MTLTSSGCWESIEVKEWPSLFTHSPVKHLMSHMWWGGNTQVSISTKTQGLEHQKLIHIGFLASTWLPENTLYYFDRTSNYTLVWWNQDHWNIDKCMAFYQQLFASVNGLLMWNMTFLQEYPFLAEICLDESQTNGWCLSSEQVQRHHLYDLYCIPSPKTT